MDKKGMEDLHREMYLERQEALVEGIISAERPEPLVKYFRKRPVVVEATQWDGSGKSFKDIQAWMGECSPKGLIRSFWEFGRIEYLLIFTMEGQMRADPGDWIIRGVQGEFYPCKPDIFAETYEEAE